MNFEWDEDKNRENIRKHGLDFNDAWQIFLGPSQSALDLRWNYGEDRWIVTGLLGNRVVVMTFTLPLENTVRIISLRKALRHEREKFEQEI